MGYELSIDLYTARQRQMHDSWEEITVKKATVANDQDRDTPQTVRKRLLSIALTPNLV
jgi:hypothetical protein